MNADPEVVNHIQTGRTVQSFEYTVHPSRVVFGPGSLSRLPEEAARMGFKRALVLSTPEQREGAERVAGLLGGGAAGVFAHAIMHVPAETTAAALTEAQGLDADCLVALGGGSTTGLAKALALQSSLPIMAIPTTYAGSEVTPIWGVTEAGVKKTGRDARVLPRCVIYDPDLTLSLPVDISVTSGLNAIAHAAEGLYAHDRNPITALMAEEGMRAIASALPRLTDRPLDIDARSDALYGAWLCGTVLGSVAMGLHHKLCHTLGGSFNLPHAAVHAVILPHALAYNAPAAAQAMGRLAKALRLEQAGSADAPRALYQLARRLGAPTSLAEIGMPADGLERATDMAVTAAYPNPRPLEHSALRALLQRAYEGVPPSLCD